MRNLIQGCRSRILTCPQPKPSFRSVHRIFLSLVMDHDVYATGLTESHSSTSGAPNPYNDASAHTLVGAAGCKGWRLRALWVQLWHLQMLDLGLDPTARVRSCWGVVGGIGWGPLSFGRTCPAGWPYPWNSAILRFWLVVFITVMADVLFGSAWCGIIDLEMTPVDSMRLGSSLTFGCNGRGVCLGARRELGVTSWLEVNLILLTQGSESVE